jgi:hypothetical protein
LLHICGPACDQDGTLLLQLNSRAQMALKEGCHEQHNANSNEVGCLPISQMYVTCQQPSFLQNITSNNNRLACAINPQHLLQCHPWLACKRLAPVTTEGCLGQSTEQYQTRAKAQYAGCNTLIPPQTLTTLEVQHSPAAAADPNMQLCNPSDGVMIIHPPTQKHTPALP